LPQKTCGGYDHYIFKVSYRKPEVRPEHSSSSPSKTSTATKMNPPWILANRQILKEAMEQYNRQATWTYIRNTESSKDNLDTSNARAIAWRLPPARRQNRQLHARQLLALQNASNIKILELNLWVQHSIDDRKRPVHSVEFCGLGAKLLPLLEAGIAGTTNLKHLHLVMYAGSHFHPEAHHERPVSFNLQPLDTLDAPNPQSLVLEVEFDTDIISKDTPLIAKLEENLRQLGEAMVEGNGSGSFEVHHDHQVPQNPSLGWVFKCSRIRSSARVA
jgi:hypothetical protein